MATKIAINGFGRIGRCITRALLARGVDDLELVGINDLTDASTLAHLLEFDSVHGNLGTSVRAEDGALVVGDRRIEVEDLPNLPYLEMVVKETLRLMPSVWAYAREAQRDMVIEGYPIKKGQALTISHDQLTVRCFIVPAKAARTLNPDLPE